MIKKFIYIFLITVIISNLLVGCNKTSDNKLSNNTQVTENTSTDDMTQSDTSNTDADSSEQLSDEEKAKLFPLDFELSDGRGNQVNLDDYKGNGNILFVNFFTTWCQYCMDEMPEFQNALNKYKDDLQVIIIDVNFDSAEKSISDVVKWYEDAGYTFPMVIDEDGSKTSEFYPYVQGYPTTFVYGPDGGFLGYLSGAMDEAMINQIMGEYTAK